MTLVILNIVNNVSYSLSEVKLQSVLCFLLFFLAISNASSEDITTDKNSLKCILPPHPQHGTYRIVDEPTAEPGEALDSVILSVICNLDYTRSGKSLVHCVNGKWSDKIPECVPTKPIQSATLGKQIGSPLKADSCVLPPQPENGSYVSNIPNASPGQAFESLIINVTCHQGYGVVGSNTVYCIVGQWSENIPKCVSTCQLIPHPSVEYRCQVLDGTRACNEYEPSGTVVIPTCRSPNYFSMVLMPNMQCLNGVWDYIAKCEPDCGRVTPEGKTLVIAGGFATHRGELPWQAGIYTKTTKPYKQICGGSVISTSIVLSAAHCFWNNANNSPFPSSNYAVAVGKIFRPWNNSKDMDQKSDVKDIKIPVRYQGIETSYQDDLAAVIVVTPFEYKSHVRPVCIHFDINFEKHQLTHGRIGKVAGWGLTGENGVASQVLMVTDLPYIDIEQCLAAYGPDFKRYLTSDKICAGYTNGSALCKGDSGGGLAFPVSKKGIERYYLHGIASTAPNNENLCNLYAYTSFTQLLKHEHFIRQLLNDDVA